MSAEYIHPQFKQLQKEYDSVVQCNRCGFCETVCPTYVVSGKETLSPRGRNQALRQILEGKIKNSESASEIFSTCLTCHACTNVCFSQVPVAKLMASARAIVRDQGKPNFLEQLVFGFLLFHRRIFSGFLWIAFFLKRIRVAALLKRTGLLKKISPELDAAEELIETVPLRFGAGTQKSEVGSQMSDSHPSSFIPHPYKVAYFSGCGIHYLYPQASQSCVRILKAVSPELKLPHHPCCGLPAHSAGELANAKKLAQKNIAQFSALGSAEIVVNDDSCCGFMKSYGELLDGDLKAIAFSKKVKNLSEFLVTLPKSEESFHPHPDTLPSRERGWKEREERINSQLSTLNSQLKKVTYHNPCQMGNAHHLFNPPREILKRLPGIDFVEMEESDFCCGGAGTYCLKHPALAGDVLERKVTNIERSGAEAVVTQASSCLLHIRYGIRKKGWQNKIRVMHLAEFLTAGMGKEG